MVNRSLSSLVALSLLAVTLCRETKMVLVLARHGARYPLSAGTSDQRKGEITENGLRMSYLLGKYIKAQYPTFFPTKFNYNQNYILASGLARTQMSAQALMLGIYDFGSLTDPLQVDKKYYTPEWAGFDIDDDLTTPLPQGFQPVPVHSFDPDENFVFEPFNLCPKINQYALQDGDARGKELLDFVNATLQEIKAEGFDYTKLTNAEKLDHSLTFYIVFDYVMSSKFAGQDVGLSDKLYQKMYVLYSMVMVYVFHRDPEHTKFIFTELGREIIGQLQQTAAALKKNDEHYNHFALFLGHDINLLDFLVQTNQTSYDCLKLKYLNQPVQTSCYLVPPYVSSLIFEVYNDNNFIGVDLSYNGQKIAFCSGKENQACSLDEAIQQLNSFVLPGDVLELRENYCYQKAMSKNKMMTMILVFNVAVIGVLGFLIYRYKKRLDRI